ncbi:MAG: DUF302 domain-containing protein [Candidatus Eutrophobiaceae bacterium]
MRQYIAILLLCLACLPSQSSDKWHGQRIAVEYTHNKSFSETVQDAEYIITEYNFRITSNMNIGATIRENGNPNFPDHQVISFCNLHYAEIMLAAADDFIYQCPYRLAISSTKHGIRVTAFLIPECPESSKSREICHEINSLLKKITTYTASEDPFELEDILRQRI